MYSPQNCPADWSANRRDAIATVGNKTMMISLRDTITALDAFSTFSKCTLYVREQAIGAATTGVTHEARRPRARYFSRRM